MKKFELFTTRTRGSLAQMTDLDDIHELHLNPDVARFNTLPIPDTKEQTRAIISACDQSHAMIPIQKYTLSFRVNTTSEFLGLVGFNLSQPKYQSAEIWFKFHPRYWNQGFGTEITKRLIGFRFKDLGLHRIHAGCAVANLGSYRVLEKAGMRREGHARKVLPLSSGWSDNFEYAILKSDLVEIF